MKTMALTIIDHVGIFELYYYLNRSSFLIKGLLHVHAASKVPITTINDAALVPICQLY